MCYSASTPTEPENVIAHILIRLNDKPTTDERFDTREAALLAGDAWDKAAEANGHWVLSFAGTCPQEQIAERVSAYKFLADNFVA